MDTGYSLWGFRLTKNIEEEAGDLKEILHHVFISEESCGEHAWLLYPCQLRDAVIASIVSPPPPFYKNYYCCLVCFSTN